MDSDFLFYSVITIEFQAGLVYTLAGLISFVGGVLVTELELACWNRLNGAAGWERLAEICWIYGTPRGHGLHLYQKTLLTTVLAEYKTERCIIKGGGEGGNVSLARLAAITDSLLRGETLGERSLV